jgi:uncharacterized protein Usg
MDLKLAKRIRSYNLTTAEILYHLPDHPAVLQTYVWQDLDIAPKFPVLNKFLEFWETNIEGKLHTVRVAVRGVFTPSELKIYGNEFSMH